MIEKAKKAEQAERAIAAKELKKDIAEALEKKRVEMEVAAKAYVKYGGARKAKIGVGGCWGSRFFRSLWLAVCQDYSRSSRQSIFIINFSHFVAFLSSVIVCSWL